MAIPVYTTNGVRTQGTGATFYPYPAGYAIDDIFILVVETANEAVTAPSSAWTEVAQAGTGTAGATGSARIAAFWKRCTSLSEPTPTVPDPGDHQIGYMFNVRGCTTTGSPVTVYATGVVTPASTAAVVPGATTGVSDCLVIAIATNGVDSNTNQFSSQANASLTSFSVGMTANTNNGVGGGFSVCHGGFASAGTYSSTTMTSATATLQGNLSFALKPPESTPAMCAFFQFF